MFLFIALFTFSGGNRKANRYLAFLTLLFSVTLMDYTNVLNLEYIEQVWIRTLLWPKEFFYGVLIYFYVRELTLPGEYRLTGKQWLHFLPGVIHVTLTWSLLALDFQTQLDVLEGNAESGLLGLLSFILGDIESLLAIGQVLIYLNLCRQLLKQHRRKIEQSYSSLEKISLQWLSKLLFGVFIIYMIWIVEDLIIELFDLPFSFEVVLGVSIVAVIYAMALLGLRQPLVFSESLERNQREDELLSAESSERSKKTSQAQLPGDPKYQNSPLSHDQSEQFFEQLQSYMNTRRPYLDNELSLPQLAEQLEIPLNYLSQVINQQAGKNFFDFVNQYRIEESKRQLQADIEKNKNVLELAMASGFNSKSAFYSAFKKHVNMTPSQYRNQLST